MGLKILGTGSSLPKLSVTNDMLSGLMDTNDEWISTRTGIKSRYICSDEKLLDLAADAAKKAIDMARIDKDEIDTIICTTVCSDYLTPSMACMINKELGISCRSLDINAACSGFIYGLELAKAYIDSGIAKKILLVSAENMTRLSDWSDRSTCVLFGDGAGATVLSEGDDLMAVSVTAKGNEELLNISGIHGNSPFDKTEAGENFLHMNGKEVYKFAVSSICEELEKTVKEAGIEFKDVDYILLHQANMRIIGAAQKRLPVAKEKYLSNIDRCGNTSSASIPILLDEEARKGRFKKGDILLMSAFGGGLTTGTCAIKWGI